MYLGSDNYLGPTAYLGPGPNQDPIPEGEDVLIKWRDLTLHGKVGRFTIRTLSGWDDLPDPREQWDYRPNQHGAFDSPVYASERRVLVSGVCRSLQERNALLRELKRKFTYGPHAEKLTIRHGGLTLSVAARLVRFNPTMDQWGRNGWFAWRAEWVAPDPFRYGRTRHTYTGLPELKGGLEYPLFTDGNVSATTYAWTATPGESSSTKSVNGEVVRENYLINPSFEYGTTGWSAGTNLTITQNPGVVDGTEGNYSAALTPDGGGTPGNALAFSPRTDVTAGETISVRGRTQRNAGSVPAVVRMLVHAYDSGGFHSTLAEVAVSTLSGSPASMNEALLEGLVVPDEVVTVQIAWSLPAGYDASGWTSGGVEIDAHMITPGEIVGDYFDGDTPDATEFGGEGWLDYGEAGSSGRVFMRNDGDAESWPVHQVRGPAPQGATITNVDTGRRLVTTTVVPPGSELTINSANGTAFLDGADRSGELVIREWVSIPPEETYTFQFTAPTFTSATLVSQNMDTYS